MSPRFFGVTVLGLAALAVQARVAGQPEGQGVAAHSRFFTSACSPYWAKQPGAPAEPPAPLPPIPGAANNDNGNLKWLAEGGPASSSYWQVRHSATNRSEHENVYVHWLPDHVLETWVEKGRTRDSVHISEGRPAAQPGDMRYGKKGQDPAPFYRKTSKAADTASNRPREATTMMAVTVQLNSQFRDLTLVARSTATPKEDGIMIDYCVELDPKQGDLARQIVLDWNAASSEQLNAVLRQRHDDTFIHLPEKGPASYDIRSKTGAALREGTLTVYGLNKDRLAAAYAPAYGPPR
jgi:hypothetical protein